MKKSHPKGYRPFHHIPEGKSSYRPKPTPPQESVTNHDITKSDSSALTVAVVFGALALIVSLFSTCSAADGFYTYWQVAAHKDETPDRVNQTPLGSFGVYYKHHISNRLIFNTGVYHESSIPGDHKGENINAVFARFDLCLTCTED